MASLDDILALKKMTPTQVKRRRRAIRAMYGGSGFVEDVEPPAEGGGATTGGSLGLLLTLTQA